MEHLEFSKSIIISKVRAEPKFNSKRHCLYFVLFDERWYLLCKCIEVGKNSPWIGKGPLFRKVEESEDLGACCQKKRNNEKGEEPS